MTKSNHVEELEVQEPKQDLLRLRQLGKVAEALEAYERRCREAFEAKDYYLAQTCIEQMAELLGTASKQHDWTSLEFFESRIKPKLYELVRDWAPKEDSLSLIELVGLKLTSEEFRPRRKRITPL